jgi:hypothetical protein
MPCIKSLLLILLLNQGYESLRRMQKLQLAFEEGKPLLSQFQYHPLLILTSAL